MNILFLTATYYPSTNGVAISVKSTAEALIKMGHKVFILAPEVPNYIETNDHILRYASATNPLNKDYPLPIIPLNAKVIELLRNTKFDVVHAHHPFHIAWFGEMFAEINKAAYIFTYHTKYEEYAQLYLKFISNKFKRQVVKSGTDHVMKRADVVITPSEALKRALAQKYPYVDVVALPTGVSFPEQNNGHADYLSEKFGVPINKTILLSLSRVAREKNIELVLKSAVRLPENYHIVIAGSGPYEEELKTLSKELDLESRVSFIGSVPHDDVPLVMKASDLLLSPSTTETQGMNLIEAMHFGLPVVAVKSDVSAEWIPEGMGTIVENNEEEYANAIVEADLNRSTEQTKKIREWAGNFTIEKTAKRLLGVYEQIIQRKS